MRAHLTSLLVTAGVLICSPAAAFSPAPPQRRDIVSPNGRFVLDADPKAGVNTVYAANDRSTPLWSFPGTLWLADALVSNDGAVVIVVQWPFVKVEHLDDVGALWFRNRDGVFLTYTVAELCPSPRPTASVGPGPVGAFWRTWRITDPQVRDGGEEFEVETTGGWTYTFRLSDGQLTGRRLNDWVVYRQWFWTAVLGVPAAVLTGFVIWRRRRPTWPRERRAMIRAGVSCAATLAVALLTSLKLAAWVEGGDDYSRRDGFLLAAHAHVAKQSKGLDKDQKKHLRTAFVKGWELVPNTARVCIMNLYLHGIDPGPAKPGEPSRCPVVSGADALATDPGDRFALVLTNPPFGKKSTIAVVNESGQLEKEDATYERQDFWTATKNKQLNFVQHVKTLLARNGRCAIVVPDNVLFEGGAGEKVRTNLLRQFDVHTLLRLPTGIFYAQGVKANVLFFDAKKAQEQPWTTKLWVYDLRTNMHFTLKTNPLKRGDLDEFVACYRPEKRHLRKSTWDAGTNPDGRWRAFEYDELAKRDKVNLDIFWLKDKSLDDSDDLPKPDVLADEIADDLETALEQFQSIAGKLKLRAN